MRITRIESFGRDELFAALRRVTLYERPFSLPYARADLTLLEACSPDDLAPTQRYVQRSELAKIAHLAAALGEHDVDLYALQGFVRFWTPGGPDEGMDLLPPVVECSREPAGPCVKLINDGMHRVYSARAARRPITVVYVAGVPDETPYYAYPNAGGWENVEELEEISEQFAKKHYRLEPHRSLYRDFNTAFRNATGFRARAVEA
ncbi:MAG: hypothetical protein HY271_13050 [Deltaproteobacteria bacterium]|nr:hypothetical protein [Deltaproteobacteria bacterium]